MAEKITPVADLAFGGYVRDYFVRVLGRPPKDDRLDELSILCESACGLECLMAINSARVLLDHVERATGTDYLQRKEAVREVALHIILSYADFAQRSSS